MGITRSSSLIAKQSGSRPRRKLGDAETFIITPHTESISVSSGKEGTTYYFLAVCAPNGAMAGLYYNLDHIAMLERTIPTPGKLNSIKTKRCIISVQLNKQGQDFVAQPYVTSWKYNDAVSGHNFDENGIHLVSFPDHISYDITESDMAGLKFLSGPKMAKPHPNISGEGSIRMTLDITKVMQKLERQYRNKINSNSDADVPYVNLALAIATGGSADTFNLTWKGIWDVSINLETDSL